MKQTFNFILNQVGFVVAVVAILLVYYKVFELTWKFVLVICAILGIVLLASKLTYRSLRKDRYMN